MNISVFLIDKTSHWIFGKCYYLFLYEVYQCEHVLCKLGENCPPLGVVPPTKPTKEYHPEWLFQMAQSKRRNKLLHGICYWKNWSSSCSWESKTVYIWVSQYSVMLYLSCIPIKPDWCHCIPTCLQICSLLKCTIFTVVFQKFWS